MNTARRVLGHCVGEDPLHFACHGWQEQVSTPPEDPTMVMCACECGHIHGRRLVEAGVVRPPSGWTVERLVEALTRPRPRPPTP